MKKFAKIAGQFVTDGDFNKIKITKNQALSIAKRQTKRLGLQDCKMGYHINENDQFYSVIVHTGKISFKKGRSFYYDITDNTLTFYKNEFNITVVGKQEKEGKGKKPNLYQVCK